MTDHTPVHNSYEVLVDRQIRALCKDLDILREQFRNTQDSKLAKPMRDLAEAISLLLSA